MLPLAVDLIWSSLKGRVMCNWISAVFLWEVKGREVRVEGEVREEGEVRGAVPEKSQAWCQRWGTSGAGWQQESSQSPVVLYPPSMSLPLSAPTLPCPTSLPPLSCLPAPRDIQMHRHPQQPQGLHFQWLICTGTDKHTHFWSILMQEVRYMLWDAHLWLAVVRKGSCLSELHWHFLSLIQLVASIVFISFGVVAAFCCAIVDGVFAARHIVSIGKPHLL